MGLNMCRSLALLLLLAIIPGVLLKDPPRRASAVQQMAVMALELPPKEDRARDLGLFDLQGIWHLTSANTSFGGYSALLALGGGQMRAFSDRGDVLDFAAPGTPARPVRLARIFRDRILSQENGDAEAATWDAASGQFWIAWENRNLVTRQNRNLTLEAMAFPPAMRGWPENTGPEAMVRLADGRFVILGEFYLGGFWARFSGNLHRGLLFPGDPAENAKPLQFIFDGPAGFRPVDMAALPDGRVLVLMRQLVWPMPARFAGRIVLADPAEITAGGVWKAREVARLTSALGADNFEGMAIEPARDGKVTIWLISDDNAAVSQRTLLWKLALDPTKLPPLQLLHTKQKARSPAARPSQKSDQPPKGPKD
jgi:hypothetical protein